MGSCLAFYFTVCVCGSPGSGSVVLAGGLATLRS